MYNRRRGDHAPHMGDINVDPTKEQLERLEELKDAVRYSINVNTTYMLADYYYQNGAIAAARYWARLWVITLGISDGNHMSQSSSGCDSFPIMVIAMGHSTPDEHGDDELVWMYG